MDIHVVCKKFVVCFGYSMPVGEEECGQQRIWTAINNLEEIIAMKEVED